MIKVKLLQKQQFQYLDKKKHESLNTYILVVPDNVTWHYANMLYLCALTLLNSVKGRSKFNELLNPKIT